MAASVLPPHGDLLDDEPADDSEHGHFLPPARDLERMKMGSSLLKISNDGKARKRHFKVSENLKHFMWIPSKKKGSDFIHLDDVEQVVLGRDSPALAKFKGTGKVADAFFSRVSDASTSSLYNIAGFLHKKGGSKGGLMSRRNWTRRWHVLNGQRVEYFKTPTDASPKGGFEISGSTIKPVEGGKYPNTFEITFLSGEKRLFRAESPEDLEAWISKLRKASRIRAEARRATMAASHSTGGADAAAGGALGVTRVGGPPSPVGAGAGAGAGAAPDLAPPDAAKDKEDTILDLSFTLSSRSGARSINIACSNTAEAAFWISGLQALVAYNKASVSASVQIYEEALERNPADTTARVNLSTALMRKGEMGPALDHLQRAVSLTPTHGKAHHALAKLLLKMERPEDALLHCRKAAEYRGSDAEVYITMGDAHLQLSAPAAAVESFEQALHVDPSFKEAHVRLADTLSSMGREDDAKRHYEEALRVDPSYKWAHVNLGLSLERQGEVDKAVEHYEKALSIDPNFVFAHFNLAQAQDRLSNPAGAIRSYEACVRIQPKNPMYITHLAFAQLAASQPAVAVDLFTAAAELSPSAATHYNVGHALEVQAYGSETAAASALTPPPCGWSATMDAAETSYRAGVGVDATSANNQYALARCLYRKGAKDDAMAYFQAAKRAAPSLEDPAGLEAALGASSAGGDDDPPGGSSDSRPGTPGAASSCGGDDSPGGQTGFATAAVSAEERQAEFFAAMKREKEQEEAAKKAKEREQWERMTEEEREEKRKEEEMRKKHDRKKERMLTSQLGAYGKRGGAIIARGRGRGRGRGRAK